MNAEQLSRRLEKVTEYIKPDSTLVDIGSDHAYLPVYCVENGLVRFAIAGEVASGPFQNAVETIVERKVTEFVSVRLGDGLAVIEKGEVDCVTVCGMGGGLISSILDRGKDKLTGKERLILQPNRGEELVRQWLYENGWQLIAEEILEEDEKIYEILVAEKGTAEQLTDAERMLGPFLLKEQCEIFRKKWQQEKLRIEAALLQLKEARPSRENNNRRKQLEQKIEMIEKTVHI